MTDIINNKKAISDLIQAIQNLEEDMKTYKVIEPFEENLINWLKSKNEWMVEKRNYLSNLS